MIWRGVFVCILLAGCAGAQVSLDPRQDANALMENGGFIGRYLRTGPFTLRTFSRITAPGHPVTVYIEGDGLAWRSRNRLSNDPTPLRQTAMRMALSDASQNVVYLARPGQFLSMKELREVSPDYWSVRRFADEVIASVNSAIDQIADEAGASRVHLVGFSGGGAIAVLTAARRSDVLSIRTVAGNLDPDEVSRIHQVSDLRGSLNPIDAAAQVADIPQIHFTGADDGIIPRAISARFERAAASNCVRVVTVDGAGHDKGWVERWPGLLTDIPDCRA